MKKLAFIPVFALLVLACDKKKTSTSTPSAVTTELADGLPDNFRAINGYFCGDARTNYSGSYTTASLTFYAAFADPARNLMANFNPITDQILFNNNNGNAGNVSVGSVFISGMQVPSSSFFTNEFHYFNNNSGTQQNFNYSPQISMQGNGTFKPMNLSVKRGYPKISLASSTSYSLSLSQNFVVDVGPIASNYDSLTVSLGYSGANGNLRKTIASGNTTTITFTSAELSNAGLYPGNNYTINFMGFNYSNITVEDKVYVFELINKGSFYLYITY